MTRIPDTGERWLYCYPDDARRSIDMAGDDKLDESLEETFPASDAPANTVETGIGGAGAASGDQDVVDLAKPPLVLEGDTFVQ